MLALPGSPGSRRASVAILVLALGVCCLSLVAAPTGATTQGGTTIELGDASGTPGTNVSVNLSVSGATVSSYEASITYDPDVVRVVSVVGVDFSDPITRVERDAGRLNLTQVNVDGVEDPTLARITFELVGGPTNETALLFDEGATALFDPDSEDVFIDTYADSRVRVETAPTPTPEPATATATPESGESNGGSATATSSGSSDGEDGENSLLASVFDQSFLLGAGFVLLVLVVAGIGYYLGSRNSRSRNDW